jgi:hypothetical protein
VWAPGRGGGGGGGVVLGEREGPARRYSGLVGVWVVAVLWGLSLGRRRVCTGVWSRWGVACPGASAGVVCGLWE